MNIPNRFWSTASTLLAILIAFVAIISIKGLKEIGYVGKNADTTNTISVEGTGDAVSMPDIATFSFTVTETAKTVADAQAAATTKLNNALKAIRDGGVADKDIQTTSYTINPHYEYQTQVCPANSSYCPGSKQVLTGYDVSQTELIKVRDLSKAGALFTSIGSLGVQNINGLSFSVDQPEAIQAQARSKAIQNAQDKAKELAKELGVSLVRIVSFSENGNYPRPMMYGMGGDSMMVKATSAPVSPEVPAGEQKVTSTVSITYEIL